MRALAGMVYASSEEGGGEVWRGVGGQKGVEGRGWEVGGGGGAGGVGGGEGR